jgi:hypothetical protein
MDVGAVKAHMIRRSSLVQPFLDEIDFAFELVVGYGRSRSVAVQGTVCSQARLGRFSSLVPFAAFLGRLTR